MEMTRLFIYRMINFQFFVINFSLFSIISLIFGARKSSAKLNKDSKNQQSSSITSKQIGEKAGGKSTEFFQNGRLTINENNSINRSKGGGKPVPQIKENIDRRLL
jgi:hypothetical protein